MAKLRPLWLRHGAGGKFDGGEVEYAATDDSDRDNSDEDLCLCDSTAPDNPTIVRPMQRHTQLGSS